MLEVNVDDYVDDYFVESEYEEVQEEYASLFLSDVRQLSREYIQRFFKDKEMYCGGVVPMNMLLTDNNISLVLNTNIEDGVRLAYKSISHSSDAVDSEIDLHLEDITVSSDVKLVMSILKKCSKSGVPKELAAGMLLLYLEFCEGIKIC